MTSSNIFSRLISMAVCCLVLATLVSCGDSGPARYELSGTITYKGKPVPAGYLRYEPLETPVNKSTVGEADIKDGKYATLLNKGSTGGKHLIFIYGFNGIPEPGSGPAGAAIFDSYATEAELPKESSTLDIEVPDKVRQLRKF